MINSTKLKIFLMIYFAIVNYINAYFQITITSILIIVTFIRPNLTYSISSPQSSFLI